MNSFQLRTMKQRAILLAVVALCASRPVAGAEPPKFARPPKFPPEVQGVFFDDARKELKGERPDYDHRQNAAAVSSATAGDDTAAAGFAWSKLIDASTIESEIKRLSTLVEKDATTPTEFKGGGFKLCRRDFSLLAALFAVTGQYDGDARWKEIAPGLREQFARAGYNCKAGSDQTFNEATQRKQEMADLIRGNRPAVPKADVAVEWAHVVDRPPLMQRLNIAQQERLTKWLADPNNFKENHDDVRHEAQLVAMIAEIITRPGFDDADDQQYLGFAHELQQAATDASAAAEKGDYDAARRAVGRAGKACTACHEAFRG
jgi:Cytochrome C'